MPTKLAMLPPEKFPVTIRLISRTGEELWKQVLPQPDSGVLEAVKVPGFGGTEHVPVRAIIEYGDGTWEWG